LCAMADQGLSGGIAGRRLVPRRARIAGPRGRSPEGSACPRGSESMRHASLSSFPVRAVFCAALLVEPRGGLLLAQQAPEPPPPVQALTPDQLDDLVAPVALYPDPLVSQILVASTYPLELVQALQWLERNPGLT